MLVTTEPEMYCILSAILYSIELCGSFVTNAYECLHF
jgi:hypothetical protein